MSAKNVLGSELQSCSYEPVTGWYRDGSCRTDISDQGMHTVCAVITEQFLSYSKAQGNNLSSPRLGFPGLKEGDHWCLCAPRWKEVFDDGMAPFLNLEATDESTLKITEIDILMRFSNKT
jgi:hypothetical protein